MLQLPGLNVLVQQYICLTDDRLVRLATCDELPFIETGAIIEQEFDMPCNQSFAVAVYGMFQFIADVLQAVYDFILFAQGQVESFIRFVE